MILGVQETWLKSSSSQVVVPGYTWFGANKEVVDSRRGEGGVGFLVHSSLVKDIKFSSHFTDSRVISLAFNGNVVLNVYNFTSQKLDEQCDLLERISQLLCASFSGFRVIILGDFNAWVGKHFGGGVDKINDSGKRLIDFCRAHSISLINVLSESEDITYVPAATIIDYIGVGPGVCVTQTRVIPLIMPL
jgi:hypothetical protein